jgi:hypothetical protein
MCSIDHACFHKHMIAGSQDMAETFLRCLAFVQFDGELYAQAQWAAGLWVNVQECAGISALKCRILWESCRESCALFAILAPTPVPASWELQEFLPTEHQNPASQTPR